MFRVDPSFTVNPRSNLATLMSSATVEPTVFGYKDADPATGPKCTRCGVLEHFHVWQFFTNGQVVECAVTA